jgi:hypothetical protein
VRTCEIHTVVLAHSVSSERPAGVTDTISISLSSFGVSDILGSYNTDAVICIHARSCTN